MSDFTIELLGYIALALVVVSYLIPTDRGFKIFQLWACVFTFFHFWGLHAFVGAASMAFSTLALTLGLYRERRYNNYISFGLFSCLFIYSLYIIEPETWMEILPAIANLVWCAAMLLFKDQKTNLMLLPVIGLWLTYTALIDSISGFSMRMLALGVLLYRIWMFSKKSD